MRMSCQNRAAHAFCARTGHDLIQEDNVTVWIKNALLCHHPPLADTAQKFRRGVFLFLPEFIPTPFSYGGKSLV